MPPVSLYTMVRKQGRETCKEKKKEKKKKRKGEQEVQILVRPIVVESCLLAWFWNIISSFSVSEE